MQSEVKYYQAEIAKEQSAYNAICKQLEDKDILLQSEVKYYQAEIQETKIKYEKQVSYFRNEIVFSEQKYQNQLTQRDKEIQYLKEQCLEFEALLKRRIYRLVGNADHIWQKLKRKTYFSSRKN